MIKVLGAGISGLTAAINLALEGYDVEVYEKNPEAGMQIRENAQMLPNWLTKESDIIQELEKCNIKINPISHINVAHLFASRKKLISFKSLNPLGYTVIRGGTNSFEIDLKRQAEKLSVVIHTNWNKRIKADIIATGHKKVDAVIYGRVYEGNFNPNEVYVFIDFKYCPGGYAYLYPHSKKRASLVVGKLASRKINLKESLKKLIENYRDVLDSFDLSLLYEFGGFSGFSIPETAIRNGSLYVGEAAGFQDPLFGFGMKYAIKSGYFAARSIIDKKNYDNLWKVEFLQEMKKLLYLRKIIFHNFDEKMLELLLRNKMINWNIEKIKTLLNSKNSSFLLSLCTKLIKLKILRNLLFYLATF